jgi:plasmid stability protein
MPKIIQIRNVPDELYRKLKSRAARQDIPLSDYMLREISSVAERPTIRELAERLATRTSSKIQDSSAETLRRERNQR